MQLTFGMSAAKGAVRINGLKRQKSGKRFETRSTMYEVGQRSATTERQTDHERLSLTPRQYEKKASKGNHQAKYIEGLLKEMAKVRDQNNMLNEYFNIFEKKYSQKKKVIEVLTKENKHLRKSLQRLSKPSPKFGSKMLKNTEQKLQTVKINSSPMRKVYREQHRALELVRKEYNLQIFKQQSSTLTFNQEILLQP